jgi:hypothetical protein
VDKKPEKKEQKKQHITVAIIEQRGESALVEWSQDGDLCRAYIPADKIKDAKCDQDVLNAGLPSGTPWEDLIDASKLTPESVGKELRRAGIWSSADIEASLQAAQRAINQATGLTPASLHGLAKKYEAKED